MRIGIDGRLSGSRHAGIGRYVENLLARLPSQAPDIEWVYFQSEPGQLAFAQNYSNVTIITAPIKHYTLQEQLAWPAMINQAKLDLFHVPHFNVPLRLNCPLVITVHDLLWHEFKGSQVTTLPAWLYWPKYLGYRLVTNQAVSRAKAILVPAETVKQTVIRYYPASAAKITVTPEGVDAAFKTSVKEITHPKKSIVYVGSLYPHKNIEIVIKALKLLPEYELFLIGARNVFQAKVQKKVEESGVAQQVHFLGYQTDQQIADRLQTAAALIQPSLSEGFGLTGVEAMAAGVPVVASDIPIFREIYQTAALYFNPVLVTELTAQLQAVLDPKQRRVLIEQGKHLSQKYNWDTMTQKTVDVYRQVWASYGG
jgi:glycosyltransferase involved in cell wall biosynthesis